MELIPYVCPFCGADLTVSAGGSKAVCKYCGKSFAVSGELGGVRHADFMIHAGRLEKYVGESTDPVIPGNVTEIGKKAFAGSNVISVTIPESVRLIDDHAFYNCVSLKEIRIPGGVERIGLYAFWGCTSLREVYIADGVRVVGDMAFRECPAIDVFQCGYGVDLDPGCPFNRRRAATVAGWKRQKRCSFCGGEFSGVFVKKCRNCGLPKAY